MPILIFSLDQIIISHPLSSIVPLTNKKIDFTKAITYNERLKMKRNARLKAFN